MIAIIFILFFLFAENLLAKDGKSILDRYNITWTTPSRNSSESMPVGGYDMGCNVWIEDGALYLYASRSGDFDENNALMKLGRIKISFSPNILIGATQQLILKDGMIVIKGKTGNKLVTGKIWVESGKPVAHVEFQGHISFSAEVEFQSWRTDKKKISSRWVVPTYIDYPGEVYWYPDVVKTAGNRIYFYHQNNNADLSIDKEIKQQGLSVISNKLWNPLRNFIFGGFVEGLDMMASGQKTGTYLHTPYKSYCMKTVKPSTKFRLDIAGFSGYYHTVSDYQKAIADAFYPTQNLRKSFIEHQQYWNNFWNRSYIIINGEKNDPKDSVWQVGRNYNLFRFQIGCNPKGEYPTKFNGGLFTFDPMTISQNFVNDNPDFRAWGGGIMTAQNQRLLYWPLLKSGDTDMMLQQFDFYRCALTNSEQKVKLYWGHGGCCFVDQMSQAGIPCGREYGWKRPMDLDATTQLGQNHQYYFTSQLEFSYMVLEYYRFTNQDISKYIPFVKASIQFFDEHYRYLSKKYFGTELTKDGKYCFYPCNALETYGPIAKNPADVICAMKRLAVEMQSLPDKYVNPAEKSYYQTIESRLPSIPTRVKDGHLTISPAESWSKIINVEIPQLYPVFPWGIFGLTKPNLNLAIDTWKYGIDTPQQKNYISWHQDAIFCARMGLVDEASKITIKKLKDSDRRYPTYWGPGHDWVPDHNWGGSGMIGLQEMLMQTPDHDILLFPAWPKTWNVNFKLRAPYRTIVEGCLKNGKIVKLEVTPESRKKDVKILLEK